MCSKHVLSVTLISVRFLIFRNTFPTSIYFVKQVTSLFLPASILSFHRCCIDLLMVLDWKGLCNEPQLLNHAEH